MTDRLCTEVVGLDGRGGAAIYASLDQWLAAYERATVPEKPAGRASQPASKPAAATPKPRKLNYREQQEFDGMEEAILVAEGMVAEREAAVEKAATAGHAALADACRALEEARQAVERLYARWQELEAKRTP